MRLVRTHSGGALIALAMLAWPAHFAPGTPGAVQTQRPVLSALAMLPADTFADGPPSGAWIEARALGQAQFPSQPVQGVSSLWPAVAPGVPSARKLDALTPVEFFALSDNGFGTKTNSSDYLLRIYRLSIEWGTGTNVGAVAVADVTTLADPDRKLPFPIVRGTTRERWLTGADLDPEAFVRMDDGSFWIGDEFGPFLFHVDAQGRLLEPPSEIPGMRSPDHPHMLPADAGATSGATVRRSRGFEGLARLDENLYAVIEAGTATEADAALVYEFDLASRAFTGMRWRLPLTSSDHALTEFVSLARIVPECGARFLAIERDNGHGADARLKRVLEVHLAGTSLTSHIVADLLDIANPQRLGGHPERFTFPFITTEAVWPLSRDEIVLANDNNFPAGGGRPGAARDATEFIRLRLARPLCSG